jgi:hypothetical protein
MKGTMFCPRCCGTKSGENPKENVLQRKKKESDESKLPRTRAQERFGVTKT